MMSYLSRAGVLLKDFAAFSSIVDAATLDRDRDARALAQLLDGILRYAPAARPTSAQASDWLEQLAPYDPYPERCHHNRTGEDNGDAHLKRTVMGREVVVAITGGQLDLGPWEQIFYGEFDGRRRKRVLVKVIGE